MFLLVYFDVDKHVFIQLDYKQNEYKSYKKLKVYQMWLLGNSVLCWNVEQYIAMLRVKSLYIPQCGIKLFVRHIILLIGFESIEK